MYGFADVSGNSWADVGNSQDTLLDIVAVTWWTLSGTMTMVNVVLLVAIVNQLLVEDHLAGAAAFSCRGVTNHSTDFVDNSILFDVCRVV